MCKKLHKVWLVILTGILCAGFLTPVRGAEGSSQNGLVIRSLPVESRKTVRKQIMDTFIERYRKNHVFQQINDYMIAKYAKLHKSKTPRPPEVVMEEAFDNARNLMDYTRKSVGNSMAGLYEPEEIEKKVRHYLWLKGVCFFLLGIGEEHKIAISFFYVRGNETLKKEFMKDVVLYSFPEIPDVPENQNWLSRMADVMVRLGVDIFSVEKYIGPDNGK